MVFENIIESVANVKVIGVDLGDLGPVGRLVLRKSAIDGINAEGKEMIEAFVRRSQAQRLTCDQIPVKCFEVADVKDDPVPLGNGPVVQSAGSHDPEQVIGY
jgi:hypothetical protein